MTFFDLDKLYIQTDHMGLCGVEECRDVEEYKANFKFETNTTVHYSCGILSKERSDILEQAALRVLTTDGDSTSVNTNATAVNANSTGVNADDTIDSNTEDQIPKEPITQFNNSYTGKKDNCYEVLDRGILSFDGEQGP